MGFDTKDKEWPKKPNQFTKALRPLTPDISHGYKIDIHIFRDTKGEYTTKNSTWIEISEVKENQDKDKHIDTNNSSGEGRNSSSIAPPPPPPHPPAENLCSKNGISGGDGIGVSPCFSTKK